MPTFALIIWTIVAAEHGNGYKPKQHYDWRPIASFRGESLCKQGAKALNLDDTRFKCVRLEN